LLEQPFLAAEHEELLGFDSAFSALELAIRKENYSFGVVLLKDLTERMRLLSDYINCVVFQ